MKNPRPTPWLRGKVIDVVPFDARLLPHSKAVQQGTCRWANEHGLGAGQLEEIMTVEYPNDPRPLRGRPSRFVAVQHPGEDDPLRAEGGVQDGRVGGRWGCSAAVDRISPRCWSGGPSWSPSSR